VAGSEAVLGQLRWAWMPAVIMLESSSMVAFARMHRRLLAAGRARFGLGPMLGNGQVIRVWAGRLGELQLSLAGWTMVIVLAVRNWLAGTGGSRRGCVRRARSPAGVAGITSTG
jgi:hypothetical protein